MPEFSPDLLASWTGGRWTAQPVSPLSGFAIDTRQLRPGQVFVAIRTEKRDGHEFLGAATLAGASAALVSVAQPKLSLPQLVVDDPLRAFQAIAREHRRRFHGPVVGISGSAGKTSTKNLLALLLEDAPSHDRATPESCNPIGDTTPSSPGEREQKCNLLGDTTPASRGAGGQCNLIGDTVDGTVLATEGNLNNHLGVPLTLTRLDPAVHRFAVIEAGISAPGEMAPLAQMIEPDVALITLVAPAHTAELGGIEGVAAEKAVLPASVRAAGVALFPRQCAEFAAFRELDVRRMVLERAEVIRPAEPPKDKVFFAVSHRSDRTAVSLAYGPPPPLTFTFRRVTDGMAQNAALAICAALWLGVTPADIQARLGRWEPAKLRGEFRDEGDRWLYLDCYNANPASMEDALEAFYAIAPAGAPRLFVLGCMEELGEDSERFHRALGHALRLQPEDCVFVIGDQAAAVRGGALERGSSPDQITVIDSLRPAAERLASWRGAVFVKGSRRYALEQVLAEKPVEAHS